MTRLSLLVALAVPAVALTAPVPKLKDPTRLLVTCENKITLMTPDGSAVEVLQETPDEEAYFYGVLSPDRKRFAYFRKSNQRDGTRGLRVQPVGGKPTVDLVSTCPDSFVWSADGKWVLGRGGADDAGRGREVSWGFWQMDPDSGERTVLDMKVYKLVAQLPGADAVADGRATPADKSGKVSDRKAEVDTTDLTPFAPVVVVPQMRHWKPVAVIAAGKKWLCEDNGRPAVYTLGEQEPVAWERTNVLRLVAIRPDGKRVAFLAPAEKPATADTTELWTADPDGGSAVKVTVLKERVWHVDWR